MMGSGVKNLIDLQDRENLVGGNKKIQTTIVLGDGEELIERSVLHRGKHGTVDPGMGHDENVACVVANDFLQGRQGAGGHIGKALPILGPKGPHVVSPCFITAWEFLLDLCGG